MPITTGTPWTDDDIARLKANCGSMSRRQLSLYLKRAGGSIATKLRELGLSSAGLDTPWTPQMVERLRELARTMTVAEIAAELEMQADTVRRKMMRSDIPLLVRAVEARRIQRPVNGAFQWTPEAIEQVRVWRTDGVPIREMGRRLGVSHNAVSGVIGRQGWAGVAKPVAKPPVVRIRRAPRVTLPALEGQRPRIPLPQIARVGAVDEREGEPTERLPAVPRPRYVADRPLYGGRGRCQYPLWPNGARPGKFPLFCEAPVVARLNGEASAWCGNHYAACHTRAVETFAPGRGLRAVERVEV